MNNTSNVHLVYKDEFFVNHKYEVVERKGIGHPDTLSDALACELSIAYSNYTINHCDGLILHHQFDKVMIIGGRTTVTFGTIGKFVEPVRVIVAGRASTRYNSKEIPVSEIINETVIKYLDSILLFPSIHQDLVIEHKWTSYAGPGTLVESTGAISEMFTPSSPENVRGYGKHYVANDTSYGVSYSPLSDLEQSVLSLENLLNSDKVKIEAPWMGTDIKIMGIRVNEKVEVTLCVPQIARYVRNKDEYLENLELARGMILHHLESFFDLSLVDVYLNTKDDVGDSNYYLTVTGSSMSGDIGVVGRGNRTNGLITPVRPMSLEGAAGKNPRYYSGIVYNIVASYISSLIFDSVGVSNELLIISQNGNPLQTPKNVIVASNSRDDLHLKKCVEQGLNKIPDLTQEYLSGKIKLY